MTACRERYDRPTVVLRGAPAVVVSVTGRSVASGAGRHQNGEIRPQGYIRVNMRGNGMTSRRCGTPVIHARNRSRPMPKPECGTLP